MNINYAKRRQLSCENETNEETIIFDQTVYHHHHCNRQRSQTNSEKHSETSFLRQRICWVIFFFSFEKTVIIIKYLNQKKLEFKPSSSSLFSTKQTNFLPKNKKKPKNWNCLQGHYCDISGVGGGGQFQFWHFFFVSLQIDS